MNKVKYFTIRTEHKTTEDILKDIKLELGYSHFIFYSIPYRLSFNYSVLPLTPSLEKGVILKIEGPTFMVDDLYSFLF